MAVIDTSIDMPKSCDICPKRWKCELDILVKSFPYTVIKDKYTNKRHKDCPLKSIDGLAEAIEQFPFTYGFASDIERVINEYCKENINGNNKES